MKLQKLKYYSLITEIKKIVDDSKSTILRTVNTELLFTYWHIGRLIIEKETTDNINEQSSRQLILELSKELTIHVGKGFSRSNLTYMRLFFLKYNGQTLSDQPKKLKKIVGQTVSDQPKKKTKKQQINIQLSWSHYIELLKIDNDLERSFYQQQSINENWSVRELQRQMDTSLFERMVLSKDFKSVLQLSKKGQKIESHLDLNKDPYILEFLNIAENERYSEKQLEQKIIDNLQKFILEIGKGFAFVGRQFRITLDNKHFFVDLVFYHRILKCFVLFDLKVREVKHQDIGQMNMYINYFEAEQNVEGDNSPIGIILTKQKGNILVEYMMKGISSKILISKYQLYLPDKKVLQKRIEQLLPRNK
jgi:predicted nuclease of restriction endonuclease-like (RecB) superfamily